MIWYSLARYPTHRLEALLGFIPSFLVEDDQRSAREQIEDRYAHGGGWLPAANWTLGEDLSITYDGDERYDPVAFTRLRGETIAVYPHAWVAIIQPNGTFEVSRCD